MQIWKHQHRRATSVMCAAVNIHWYAEYDDPVIYSVHQIGDWIEHFHFKLYKAGFAILSLKFPSLCGQADYSQETRQSPLSSHILYSKMFPFRSLHSWRVKIASRWIHSLPSSPVLTNGKAIQTLNTNPTRTVSWIATFSKPPLWVHLSFQPTCSGFTERSESHSLVLWCDQRNTLEMVLMLGSILATGYLERWSPNLWHLKLTT